MLRANPSRESFVIVGGTYHERCESPRWNELYGSGFRAAAALANHGVSINLYTCADDRSAVILRSLAAALQIALEIIPVSVTPTFAYLHPLDDPTVVPRCDEGACSASAVSLNVSASNVLRYGMMEATAIVRGEMVVYDPQSPLRPEAFGKCELACTLKTSKYFRRTMT